MNYENEEWRDIKFTDTDGKEYDYSGKFQVSDLGRVRDAKTGKISPQQDNGGGYLTVSLGKGKYVKGSGKVRFYVHRLVGYMFVRNDDPINKTQINHQNEIRNDNKASNLSWVTPKENCNYGSHKENISKSKKGKCIGSDNPRAKKVICLETKQIFGTVKDAEKWCNRKGVATCCRGETYLCGGYHWMFLTDYNKASAEEIEGILKIKAHISERKIICLETQEVFDSAMDACEWCGLKNANSIRCCCKDTNRTANNYHWMYYEEYLKLSEHDIEKILNEPQERKVICLEKEKVFDSIKEAEKWLGVSIKTCLKGNTKTAGKCHWMFYDEYLKLTKNEVQTIINKLVYNHSGKNNPRAKKVLCIETCKTFNTAKEAAEWCNGDNSSIGKSCKGKIEIYKGYHWQYLEDYEREQGMNTDINNSRLAV